MHSWFTTGTWGGHKGPGKQGHCGGWVGSPIFPVALQNSPPGLSHKVPRHTHVPYTVTKREHVSHWSPDCHSTWTSAQGVPSPHLPTLQGPSMAAHSTRTKWSYSLPGCDMGLDQSGDKPASCPKEPPQQRQREGDTLDGQLKDAHQEAFGKDSYLVKEIRCT